MANAVCAAHSFCHRSDTSESEETLNTLPGLETSVSFGRFVSESLDWGRFSSFRQNKYMEEVQKSSKPGSVAQMKAHFEAHFKRAAELRAAAKAAGEDPNLTVSEQPQIETDLQEEQMGSFNDVEIETNGESPSKTFTNENHSLTFPEKPQLETDLLAEHRKNLNEIEMEANEQSPSKTFAKDNSNLTVPEQALLGTDLQEEHMKNLNDVEMEANGESPSKTLTGNGETEGTEIVTEEFNGDFVNQKKRKSNNIAASEERALIIAEFNGGDENQGLYGSPRKIHQVPKLPLQESSSVNREIPSPCPSKGNKQTSTFISFNCSPENPQMSFSTLRTPSRSCPLKSSPVQETLTKRSPLKSSLARENLTRSCLQKSSPVSENLTKSRSSKSTPAQKNPTKSLPLKSTSAQENRTPCSSKSPEGQPSPKMRDRYQQSCLFDWSKSTLKTLVNFSNRTKKSNVTSQSVAISCWNSSRSMWKKPVQAVCSPFKYKSEERAEKRREFNCKVEDKLKAERIEKDKKAKVIPRPALVTLTFGQPSDIFIFSGFFTEYVKSFPTSSLTRVCLLISDSVSYWYIDS